MLSVRRYTVNALVYQAGLIAHTVYKEEEHLA